MPIHLMHELDKIYEEKCFNDDITNPNRVRDSQMRIDEGISELSTVP